MSRKQRIEQQPAYVLHTLPWRETSLIIETFSRDYGRVALVAKGARRPGSQLRAVLMPFQPVLLDWSGAGELKLLMRAERDGWQPMLAGQSLMCGFYLNELLLALTAREDAHSDLFAHYVTALAGLTQDNALAITLRSFELRLLASLGYGLSLAHEANGSRPIRPDQRYLFVRDQGFVAVNDRKKEGDADGEPYMIEGRVLLDLAQGQLHSPEALAQSKRLLRRMINDRLEGRLLQSRRILEELQQL